MNDSKAASRSGRLLAGSVSRLTFQQAALGLATARHAVTTAPIVGRQGYERCRLIATCRVDQQAASPSGQSDLSLLGYLQSVIHLDAKVPHRRLKSMYFST
jgi:hypothetical protein